MKLDERELGKVERLVLAWPEPPGSHGGEGSSERPLSLSALLDQRQRALENRVG